MSEYKRIKAAGSIPVQGRGKGKPSARGRGKPINTADHSIQAMNTTSLAPANVGVMGPVGITPMAARTFKMPVNANAGAGAPNFSGTWKLDRETSDSTNDYLQAMGLPEIARQAADKLDITIVIQQNANDFIITRKTQIFKETKILKFGQEIIERNNTPILVTGDSSCVKTITKLSMFKGTIKDTRTLENENKRMRTVLELILPDREPVIMTRFFNKDSDSISTIDIPLGDENAEHENKRKR